MREILERLEAKVDKIDSKLDKVATKTATTEVKVDKIEQELSTHLVDDNERELRLESLESKSAFNSGFQKALSIVILCVLVPLAVAWAKSHF